MNSQILRNIFAIFLLTLPCGIPNSWGMIQPYIASYFYTIDPDSTSAVKINYALYIFITGASIGVILTSKLVQKIGCKIMLTSALLIFSIGNFMLYF